MSTELTLPAGFGPVSNLFAPQTGQNDDLGAGIAASYGVLGFKGKVWSTKFGGVDTPMMRDDGDGPRNSIEVVIVKAAPAISKIFYKGGYVDGSTAAPDCWSGNGQTPDRSVQNKVHDTCAACPMNAWGSKVTEAGKQTKACADSRRIAVVPIADLQNEAMGGPMLLRIPAASLKDLKAYGDLLVGYQYPYYAVATRISFDAKEAYPKFVFNAIRPLTDAEARDVIALQGDKRVAVVLNEVAEAGAPTPSTATSVAASPFEMDEETGELTPDTAVAAARDAEIAAAATKAAAAKVAAAKVAAAKAATRAADLAAAREIEAKAKAAQDTKATEEAALIARTDAAMAERAAKAKADRIAKAKAALLEAEAEAEEMAEATGDEGDEAGQTLADATMASSSVASFDAMLDGIL